MNILLSIKSLGLNTCKDGLSMFVVKDTAVVAVVVDWSLLACSGLVSDQTGLQSVGHLTVRRTFYHLGLSKHLDSWACVSAGTGVIFFRRKSGVLYWYRGVTTLALPVSLTISVSVITVKHFQAEVRTGGFDGHKVFKVRSAETSQLQHFLVL